MLLVAAGLVISPTSASVLFLHSALPEIMEHSSPLAAMQPPTMFFGHCFRPEPTSYTTCGPQSGIRPSPFNFKDLSMKKGQGDYFGMDPVRGSSPTASLAADLSQNFHIDQRFVTSGVHVTALILFVSLCICDKESNHFSRQK